MKRLEYQWDDEYYLLHLQLTLRSPDGASAALTRHFDGAGRRTEGESIVVQKGSLSHRIMVCRTHPTERGFAVEYPDAAVLEIFRLEDRAYYPTRAFRAS